MLPVNNLINQIFFGSYQWDIYNQRFSSSIPVDRVTGPGQTQIGYWSDSQLWQTIAWSRFAYERNPVVKGIINILIDHIGKPHVEWVGDKNLARKVSKLWEKFSRVNCLGDSGYLTTGELSQDREKEIRVRWLRDGEVFIRFFVKDVGYPLVLRFVEPEQVRTPPIDRDEKFSHTWGIVTEIDDNENIRGYWVYYPNQGEWDYVHRRYMVYGRRNADRNVKRGLPEIANLELDFAHLWQLLRGVTITSKAQASIAWIEKYPGAMLDQILAHSISTKDTGTTSFGAFKPGTPNLSPSFYGVDPNAKSIDPGTILSVNQGKEYEPGPTSDPQKYIDACASILHLLSLQWCLPDWITKGPEAYASALVSGSPFVRRIESMQADYAAIFGQLCTTFVRLAERLGWLERKTLQRVQPVVRLPSVIMADEIKQVETLQKELQSGLLSEIEYLHKRGRDPRKTLAQRKKWRELLSKYGVGETQQGVSEDKEETKPKKFRDYLNPPGSRILREEQCNKVDFQATEKLSGKCVTVKRCDDWEPGPKSPYEKGCRKIGGKFVDVSTGKPPHKGTSDQVDNHTKITTAVMEAIYRKVGEEKDHNARQKMMGEITSLSSSIVACGYLKELSTYDTAVKKWVMEHLAKSVQGNDKVAKLFKLDEVTQAGEDEDKLNELIEKAAEKLRGEVTEIIDKYKSKANLPDDLKNAKLPPSTLKGDTKSAASPVLDMIAEMAIDSLNASIQAGQKFEVKGEDEKSDRIRYAIGTMDFIPNNMVKFLGGAMTLGSIEHQIGEHQKVMLQSSVLKTLAGRIPYLQNVEIDENLSKFAFGAFVSVDDKTYANIINNVGKLLNEDTPYSELKPILENALAGCPNIYGSLGGKKKAEIAATKEAANQLLADISSIQDEKEKVRIEKSILLRCVFSYGGAEIARRGNEEAWARHHGAGMAYNPQFPGIDNVTAVKNKDGTYSLIPMSHKMHMTKDSNKPEDELGKMNVIEGLIETHGGKVDIIVRARLRKILEKEGKGRTFALNRYLDNLKTALEKHNCHTVDWGKDSKGNKDTCFKLDYTRMILKSLSNHIEKMNLGDIDKISYEPITLVRFRPRSIEYYRKVKIQTETGQEVIEIQGAGAYNVREGSYEDRETMVGNALGAYERYVDTQNKSQVQQPKA